VTRTSKRERSATITRCREFGRSFLTYLAHEFGEVLIGSKRYVVTPVELIESFLGGGAQPFELCFIFEFALLQQPEAFAHHLARVAEAAGCDACFDEAVQMFCQVYVAGWYGGGPSASTLAGLTIIANPSSGTVKAK
jgi:hypothetical protein